MLKKLQKQAILAPNVVDSSLKIHVCQRARAGKDLSLGPVGCAEFHIPYVTNGD